MADISFSSLFNFLGIIVNVKITISLVFNYVFELVIYWFFVIVFHDSTSDLDIFFLLLTEGCLVF